MEPDSFALRTGLFIILGAALLITTVTLFSRAQIEMSRYEVFTEESVSGLDAKSRVYYKGVEVGLVDSISFDRNDYNVVRIAIDIDSRIPLGQNTYAQLALRGITGEYDLTLNNDGELGPPLVSTDGPAVIPMRSDTIAKLGDSFSGALDEIRRLAKNLQDLTAEPNQERVADLLDALTTAAEGLAETAARVETAVGQIDPAVDAFADAMASIDQTARQLGNNTTGLDELIGSLDRSMEAIGQLVAVAESETLHEVDHTLVALRVTLGELTELARSLQRDPQSLLLGQAPPRPGPGEVVEGRR